MFLKGEFFWDFAKEIEKLVVLFFLLVEITVFCGIFNMCCAQFWVDLFTLCFAFYHSTCNSFVTLFFETRSWTACLFFRGKCLAFASFVVLWFVSVSFAHFSQFLPAICCFYLCSGLLTYVISIASIAFVMLLKFWLIILLGLVFAFFVVNFSVLHRFPLARFAFLMYFFTGLCNCTLDICIPNLLQASNAQNYPNYTL